MFKLLLLSLFATVCFAQIATFCGETSTAQYCLDGVGQCVPCKAIPVLYLKSCKNSSLVALTFIGGPWPSTPSLLTVLNNKGVKGNFFVAGSQLETATNKALLQRMAGEGHIIGSYGYRGTSMLNQDQVSLYADMVRTNNAINSIVGVRPRYVRPPGGDMSSNNKVYETLTSAPSCYDRVVSWNVDTRDFANQDTPSAIVGIVSSELDKGKSVITVQSDQNAPTNDQVGNIIDVARSKGFIVVPLNECFGDHTPYINQPTGPSCDFQRAIPGASSAGFISIPTSLMFQAIALLFVSLVFAQ